MLCVHTQGYSYLQCSQFYVSRGMEARKITYRLFCQQSSGLESTNGRHLYKIWKLEEQ